MLFNFLFERKIMDDFTNLSIIIDMEKKE